MLDTLVTRCMVCGKPNWTGPFGKQKATDSCRACGSPLGGPVDKVDRTPVDDAVAAPPPPTLDPAATAFVKFEHRAPSSQTAVDVFRGRWASDLDELLGVDGTGPNHLFTQDERPFQLATAFGRDGSLDGMTVLEIGPLEAAHTYRLEQLGAASITTVESSVEAWLKCLIVKEQLDLTRSTFLLGDVVEYLQGERPSFDIVMCSGVLYHMADPLSLISEVAAAADRCFVWTHYYDPERHPVKFAPRTEKRADLAVTYWSHTYGDLTKGFWGGIAPTASWMTKEDILAAFRHFGMSEVNVIRDDFDHPNGPSFTFTAARPAAGSSQDA